MATASTTTVLDHSSTTGFRAWVAEFIAQLNAVGLTQTSDTGQIDTTTVTRPGVSTNAGYAIFRFNDTLHNTTPIFIRFDFGTDASATIPRIQVAIGSGTDGAGVITGAMLGQRAMTHSSSPNSTSTSYVSRFCYNANLGFLGVAWKTGAQGTDANNGVLFIGRTTNSSGAPTDAGVYNISMGGTISATGGGGGNGALYQQVWDVSSATRYPVNTSFANNAPHFGFWPHNLTSTQVGSDTYVVPFFYATPAIDTHLHCGLVLRNEVPVGNTFSLATKGSTARTFISIGHPGATSVAMPVAGGATSNVGLFMLWE
jgi:hypothetical protein